MEQQEKKQKWCPNPNGRPKKEVKKSENIIFRFFPSDVKKLNKVAELEGMKRANLIIKALEEYYDRNEYRFDGEGNLIEDSYEVADDIEDFEF